MNDDFNYDTVHFNGYLHIVHIIDSCRINKQRCYKQILNRLYPYICYITLLVPYTFYCPWNYHS